jgi:hypothetical protein
VALGAAAAFDELSRGEKVRRAPECSVNDAHRLICINLGNSVIFTPAASRSSAAGKGKCLFLKHFSGQCVGITCSSLRTCKLRTEEAAVKPLGKAVGFGCHQSPILSWPQEGR